MKIEFKKVSHQVKDFNLSFDNGQFFGSFLKTSSNFVELKSNIKSKEDVICCKCGTTFKSIFNEKLDFLLCDGIHSSNIDEKLDKIIIEIDNDFIDFREIYQSEIDSFKSDYHICSKCDNHKEPIELKY